MANQNSSKEKTTLIKPLTNKANKTYYCVYKTIVQYTNSTAFELWMFLMFCPFKEKLENEISKSW